MPPGIGADAPSRADTTSAGERTQPPAATTNAESRAPVPSVDVNQAASLEELLPDELDGVALLKFSVAGDEFERTAGESERALLGRLDASPSDVSAAFAVDPSGEISAQIVALRVAGAPTERLRDEYRAAVEAQSGASLREATIGGKRVLTGASPDDPGSVVYFYASDDVLFFVFTDDPGLAAEALTLLP